MASTKKKTATASKSKTAKVKASKAKAGKAKAAKPKTAKTKATKPKTAKAKSAKTAPAKKTKSAAKAKSSKASKTTATKKTKAKVTKTATAKASKTAKTKSAKTKTAKVAKPKAAKAAKPKSSGSAKAKSSRAKKASTSRAAKAAVVRVVPTDTKEAAREIATVALARVRQDGRLNVRQKERLRRALISAGGTIGWGAKAATSKDPIGDLSKDLKRLTNSGATALKKEVSDELKGKKTEVARLESSIASIRELALDPETTYPRELTYVHTARDAVRGLVTKTELVTVADAAETDSAANAAEKGLNRWTQLKDQMVEELNLKQRLLGTLTNNLPDFVAYCQQMLKEVVATLH